MLIVSQNLNGFEYGAQRDFEQTICDVTGFEKRSLKEIASSKWLTPGTRYWKYRRLFPLHGVTLPDGPQWMVLMGPESFPYWRFRSWDKSAGPIVVYLFDTLVHQLSYIKEMINCGRIDVLITSFPNAVEWLNFETRRNWFSVVQGVCTKRFFPIDNDPCIAFTSYGRRLPKLHEAIRNFCKRTKQHYEFSVSQGIIPGTDPTDAYESYAWHLRNSWFNVCWPVEITNPKRAPTFSPLTCRWFEAAASGSIIIGKPPMESDFEKYFSDQLVESIDPDGTESYLLSRLEYLWENRQELRQKKLKLLQDRIPLWTWESRVKQISEITQQAVNCPT